MSYPNLQRVPAFCVAEQFDDDRDDEDESPGGGAGASGTPSRWAQYASRGTGYLPVHQTHARLPAGCYRLARADMYGKDVVLEPANVLSDDVGEYTEGAARDLLHELRVFWEMADAYRKMGCVHKRGILLWGPPGSGKTSLVATMVKQHLGRDGVVMIANRPELLPTILPRFRSVEPERPLFVIWEDLETGVGQGKSEADILSMLDGNDQVDHVVFVATTNYPERLDARLLNRPGRLDRIVKIGLPDAAARRRCFVARAGSATGPGGEDLVAVSDGLSYAHLRELMVGVFLRRQSPAELAARLKRMRVTPKSGGGTAGFGFGEEE